MKRKDLVDDHKTVKPKFKLPKKYGEKVRFKRRGNRVAVERQ